MFRLVFYQPMTSPTSTSPRDALLDAAESVVLRDGITGLTLDAVATLAGASKGGLLHHFRSKDALIRGLVERTVDRWRADYSEAIEAGTRSEPGQADAAARALISMSLGDMSCWTETCRRSSVVLVAALANDPGLVAPVRGAYAQLLARIDSEGLDPGVVEVVMLVVHGLWFEWMFALREMTPERLAMVHETLCRMLAKGACVNVVRNGNEVKR